MPTVLYEKAICPECAGFSLGRYIKSHGECDICNYCRSNTKPVMTIEQLLPRMYKSWELYYESPEEYPALQTSQYLYYADSMIDDDDDLELYDAKDEFINDLKSVFKNDDKTWIRKRDVWTPFSNALKLSWERFCAIIKTQWRYTYFLCENDVLDPATYSPTDTLENICEIVKSKKELISDIPPHSSIFRCREANCKMTLTAKSLGTAPTENANANRFSPKGISMFYGSLDEETCKMEVCGNGKNIVIGEFYNSKPIRVLDLTNIPPVPKLYDDDFGFIPAWKFLNEFKNLIGRRNTAENDLEYIPTQVFTEYIRRNLHDLNLRGIKYQSAENPKGTNLVLFYTNDECIDGSEYDGTSDRLILKKWCSNV